MMQRLSCYIVFATFLFMENGWTIFPFQKATQKSTYFNLCSDLTSTQLPRGKIATRESCTVWAMVACLSGRFYKQLKGVFPSLLTESVILNTVFDAVCIIEI